MVLSIQKRWKIVFLYLNKLGLRLSIRTIAKKLQYSQDIVRIQINRYQETGDIQDEEGKGRKRKILEREDLDIISTAKRLRISLSAEISISIKRQGIDISSTIVRRRLNEKGLYKL